MREEFELLDYENDGYSKALRACLEAKRAFQIEIAGKACDELRPLLVPSLFANMIRLSRKPKLMRLQGTLGICLGAGMHYRVEEASDRVRVFFSPRALPNPER